MQSTNETGHAKNVANFQLFISFCNGYGAKYNPSKEALKAANLQTMLSTSKTILSELKVSETAFKIAINNRIIGFKPLRSFCTQIINALDATDAADETVKNARTINRKIQGQRAKPKEEKEIPVDDNAPMPSDKTISVSQQSFDSLVDHFEKLVTTVTADPNYKPNEEELTSKSLNDKLTEMQNFNTEVINKFTAVSNSRIKRDNQLYHPLTGLVQVTAEVKNYVLSVYKSKSPEYRQISGIEFKKRA